MTRTVDPRTTLLVRGRTATGCHSAGTGDAASALAKMNELAAAGVARPTCTDGRGQSYSREQLRDMAGRDG